MSTNSCLPRGFQWAPSSKGNVPPNAVAAGNDKSGEKLYIARVIAGNAIYIGKCGQHVRGALAVCSGREQFFNNYEILCGPSAQVRWVECVGAFDFTKVSGTPLVGGSDVNGAAQFITRLKTASRGGRSASSIGVQPGSITALMNGTSHPLAPKGIVSDGISWTQVSNGHIPPDAIIGGEEGNAQGALYIARAFFKGGSDQPGSLQVGKTGPYIGGGSFAYNGKEVKVTTVEVPTAPNSGKDLVQWVAVSGQLDLGKLGATPVMCGVPFICVGAVIEAYSFRRAGVDVDGSILYVAHVKSKNIGIQPGKVSVNYEDGMHFGFGNAERTSKDYEVLCYK
ncbi:hypothetical protein AURDEDRAFT_162752 [Auricularia subglabra TFB-10046 SS5]|nr:hypothetical protein AURDEDRAFT_162752 [Auricularia subglabra TFB-10046 SS5]